MSNEKNHPYYEGECPTHRSIDETALDVPFASSSSTQKSDDDHHHDRNTSNTMMNRSPQQQQQRTCFKIIVFVVIIITLIAAISVGVYCGQGYCSSPLSEPTPTTPPPPDDDVDDDDVPNPTIINEMNFSSSLTSYINNITLSGRTISMDGVTPEDVALQFMISNETTTSVQDVLFNDTVRFRLLQRFALLCLWFQQSINGIFIPSWTYEYTMNWGSIDECSGWAGISCITIVNKNGNDQKAVSAIEIIRGNIGGSIPADIGLLTSLISLDLSENSIEGTLPESIGYCTNLMTIKLGSNEFIGSLPTSITKLFQLTQIDLSSNQFGGNLPDDIGQWTSMQHFNVYNNLFGGTIPTSVNQWRALSTASFHGNGFTGTIPSQVCNNTGNPYAVASPIFVDCAEVHCDCCFNCFY